MQAFLLSHTPEHSPQHFCKSKLIVFLILLTSSFLLPTIDVANISGDDHLAPFILPSLLPPSLGEHGGLLLRHAAGHRPARKQAAVPLNRADDGFLEALLRLKAAPGGS
ncbi:hypothetical protein OU994_13250 [Pseudoduganella sp. SL102]|uniref:hypothetical protein n=1 Tax=Pseudoduganella sp. SL102 TaxID=2995154 RepID=UPI00248C6A3A|nr:hypothetical protein [Pseudoduganella sp. SL102]WBS05169.1 hypothetical protein OU994_13250 [Pseudoduganella sp. SL102]